MWGRKTRSVVREQLDAALSAEIQRYERVWSRISAGVYGLLGLFAVSVALTGAAPFGLMLAGVCFALVAYFLTMSRLSARAEPPLWIPSANTLLSAIAPWVFMGALAFGEGAAYALSSWIPPLVFLAVMVGSIMRLRPFHAFYAGVVSAAMFLAVYFILLLPMLQRLGPIELVAQPKMEVQRALLLVFTGGAVAVVTAQLRRLVGRAEGAVREQDLFGKYRLVGTIASGGMGEILEAMYCPEGGFERRVAIKRIHGHLADQQRFIDAFRSEAELSARLAHPNVVQVMDFGKIASTYFLAMEFVDGVTLAAVRRRVSKAEQPLATELVGFIGTEILTGLAYAHHSVRGEDGRPLRIVHRDVCPQNILLSRNGEVKVADFGIARVLGEAMSTQTRTIAGHMAYISPEQAKGAPIDERCDLFSVAVILWELLAARRLFSADNEAATLMAVATLEIPPIRSLRPELAPGWDAFFARALERDPAQRFSTAAEMADALSALAAADKRDATERLVELVESIRNGRRDVSDDAVATQVFVRDEPAVVADDPTGLA